MAQPCGCGAIKFATTPARVSHALPTVASLRCIDMSHDSCTRLASETMASSLQTAAGDVEVPYRLPLHPGCAIDHQPPAGCTCSPAARRRAERCCNTKRGPRQVEGMARDSLATRTGSCRQERRQHHSAGLGWPGAHPRCNTWHLETGVLVCAWKRLESGVKSVYYRRVVCIQMCLA